MSVELDLIGFKSILIVNKNGLQMMLGYLITIACGYLNASGPDIIITRSAYVFLMTTQMNKGLTMFSRVLYGNKIIGRRASLYIRMFIGKDGNAGVLT